MNLSGLLLLGGLLWLTSGRRQRNPPRRRRNPRGCLCGSGAACRPNPFGPACMRGPGVVEHFRAGGRCSCCNRMAPRKLVELSWDEGGSSRYGSTCAARAIGTKPSSLRREMLAALDARGERERGQAETFGRHGRARSSETGIQRPPWAVGLSDAQVTRLAREAGRSPYEARWWQGARMETGRGEMQDVLSYARLGRTSGGSRRGRRPARRVAPAPRRRGPAIGSREYTDLPF